ncbi:Uncharacterised protein [Bordetella pertussis]|nr:Uncharacterised protein [Bordetella pertussis]CFO68668.1 Uncharacterised protein [Bordetella pertussis]CFT86233.1 Uncharacterised protein [Bordetella pertussis]CPH89686.1 Uncharacterised protein [Bordetella pertussis]CPK52089.1 Uncharacterised protein [Bordetella pertussis]
MFQTMTCRMRPTPVRNPSSPLWGTAISGCKESRITNVTNTARNRILHTDLMNSIRLRAEKIFFKLPAGFSFSAEGLSFRNASTTPTCRNSANIPTPSTMRISGASTRTA